jgi:hypothetical protein
MDDNNFLQKSQKMENQIPPDHFEDLQNVNEKVGHQDHRRIKHWIKYRT